MNLIMKALRTEEGVDRRYRVLSIDTVSGKIEVKLLPWNETLIRLDDGICGEIGDVPLTTESVKGSIPSISEFLLAKGTIKSPLTTETFTRKGIERVFITNKF